MKRELYVSPGETRKGEGSQDYGDKTLREEPAEHTILDQDEAD